MARRYFSGTVCFTVADNDYEASVRAEADYEYDPGMAYLRNGDPGYPPEESFDIRSVEVDEVQSTELPPSLDDSDERYEKDADFRKDVDSAVSRKLMSGSYEWEWE